MTAPFREIRETSSFKTISTSLCLCVPHPARWNNAVVIDDAMSAESHALFVVVASERERVRLSSQSSFVLPLSSARRTSYINVTS
jgi:hypothetical protein